MAHVFKRKIYSKLLEWKSGSKGRLAVLIEGARRVGKSTVVREFAKNEYRSALILDFDNLKRPTRELFENGLQGDVSKFLQNLQLLENTLLTPRESIIVFDEVQRCPKAREMIKYLVEDGRFDYIETGSLITLKSKSSGISIPSEEYPMSMGPMDFEEYCWAKGDHVTIPNLKKHFDSLEPFGDAMHAHYMGMYREYMAIGGMPQVVSAYLTTGDLSEVEKEKKAILGLYHNDIARISTNAGIKVERLFDSIPSLLSKTSKLFSPGEIKEGARTRSYYDAVDWLSDSRTVNVCVANRDPSPALKLALDDNTFKCYLLDTGLLVSQAAGQAGEERGFYRELMLGRLSVNKGMFFENMVAQEFRNHGYDLVFSVFKVSGDNRLREVDFLLSRVNRLIPVEVKSSHSKRHASLDEFMERHGGLVDRAYVVHTGDIETDGKIVYIPIYLAQFI